MRVKFIILSSQWSLEEWSNVPSAHCQSLECMQVKWYNRLKNRILLASCEILIFRDFTNWTEVKNKEIHQVGGTEMLKDTILTVKHINKRPSEHIAHLRKLFQPLNTFALSYDYNDNID